MKGKRIILFFILLLSFLLVSCGMNNTSNSDPNDDSNDLNDDINDSKGDGEEGPIIIESLTFENKEVTYDGKQHSIYIVDELPEEVDVEYTNNGQVNAGVYTVTATLSSNSENIIIEQEEYTATLIISKEDIRKVVSFEGGSFEYTGNPNYIYATNIPEGVEVEYTDNGRIEVGSYYVEARFVDTTGNYDCTFGLYAALNITKSSKLRTVTFYNENNDLMKTVEIMEGEYITSDLIPSFNHEPGFTYSWDYDFTVKVTTNLNIHLKKVGNEYKMTYYLNDSFEEEFKIKEETIKIGQLLDMYTYEYDECTYADTYKVYHKNQKNEYEALVDKNEQQVIFSKKIHAYYSYAEDVYLVPVKENKNIKFEYVLDEVNKTAKVLSFFSEEVIIPKAIYVNGEEYIIDEINEGATESHALLTTLHFTEDTQMKKIGNRAFKWSELSYIKLPNTIEYIGEEAFYSCKLNEIIIQENINNKEIYYGSRAFAYCVDLTFFSIPKLENQDLYYLFDSTELPNLTISIDNLMMTDENERGFFGGSLHTLIIKTGSINYGFNNLASLENLYIGNTVFFLAEVVNVNNVYVEKSLEDWIYSYFFSINLSPAYHSNYFYVYENNEYTLCPSEISVAISPNKGSLSGVKQITKIIFEEGITEINELSCAEIPNLKEVVISSTVQKISGSAFDSCWSLEKVEFSGESSLERIGNRAFGCTSLNEIILPSNLKYIDSLAFVQTKLTEVFIPKNVETIEMYAFYQISTLKNIIFEKGSSLKYLGIEAFYSPLENIYFGSTKEEWLNIEINDENNYGIFMPYEIPNCFLLNENGEYYLANDIIIPNA